MVGPQLRGLIGVGIGYIAAVLILVSWISLRTDRGFDAVLFENWFWPFSVAVTTYFILYYLGSIRKTACNTWCEGLMQSFAQGVGGLLVSLLAISEQSQSPTDPSANPALVLYVTLTLTLVG